MPELIFSLEVKELASALLFLIPQEWEVRPIIRAETTYQDLVGMFGSDYEMPPEADFEKGDEIEYRCPYIPKCPAKANCFVVGTPKPLQEKEVLNIKCRLCGNRKIPVYAGSAARRKR